MGSDLKYIDHVEQTEWEYRPGRKVRRGETIRLSGGPVYIDPQGNKHAFGERGKHKFLAFCQTVNQDGKVLEEYLLTSQDGTVVVPLNQKRSRYGMKIKFRSYKISRVRG